MKTKSKRKNTNLFSTGYFTFLCRCLVNKLPSQSEFPGLIPSQLAGCHLRLELAEIEGTHGSEIAITCTSVSKTMASAGSQTVILCSELCVIQGLCKTTKRNQRLNIVITIIIRIITIIIIKRLWPERIANGTLQ